MKDSNDDMIQWSLPGRSATEAEILQMIDECEDPEGEMDSEAFFDSLLKGSY